MEIAGGVFQISGKDTRDGGFGVKIDWIKYLEDKKMSKNQMDFDPIIQKWNGICSQKMTEFLTEREFLD